MNILRKIALVLVMTLLPTALFSFGLLWSLHQTFGTPGHIESALDNSGIYNSIVGNALIQAQNKQQPNNNHLNNNTNAPDNSSANSNSSDDIPFSNPAIRSIIEQAFPPQFLKAQTNQVLDSTYGWIQGKQPNLAFTINLTSAKAALANGIGEYTQKQLASLPQCAPNEIPSGDINPFEATCVPKGFDIAAAAAKAHDKIASGDFLKDAQITTATIKNDKGQTLDQQLKNAPKVYHKVNSGIYGLGTLALLLSGAVILVSASWRSGVRKLACVFISVGVASAFLAWAISFGLHHATGAIAKNSTANKALQDSILRVAQLLAHDLQTYWMGYGITLLVLGIGGLVALMMTKPKKMVEENAPVENDVPPTESENVKSVAPKEVRVKRKVQG